MYRRFAILLLIVFLTATVVGAQTDDPAAPQPRVLVAGVDINGQGFPLVVIDLEAATARTLATFAYRPVCLPGVYSDGQVLLYELIDASAQLRVYQVDVNSGERAAVSPAQDLMLDCPVISPDNVLIAWLQEQPLDDEADGSTQTALVFTDVTVTELTSVATHSQIFDVMWSPGGGALVYQAVDDQQPYPSLYSLPREGATTPRLVFDPGQGLLVDYIWAQNSSGLLVAYYTEEYLAVALLGADCVIGPGDPCQIDPLATFSPDASVSLLNAFSPIAQRSIISLQIFDPVTERPRTDLWILDLTGDTEPQQLTFSADIIETDAYWDASGDRIYYIASRSDPQTRLLHGGIYMAVLGGTQSHVQVFESTVFLPSAFLHWYE